PTADTAPGLPMTAQDNQYSTELEPEAAVPLGVFPQRAEEVHPPEGWPVGVRKPNLGVGRLPQQKARKPLLPRRPYHQVRVWWSVGVRVVAQGVDGNLLGDLFRWRAVRSEFRDGVSHRIDDLLPSSVADGDVDAHACVIGGELLVVFQSLPQLLWQQ